MERNRPELDDVAIELEGRDPDPTVEALKALDKSAAAEAAIAKDFGELVGALDRHQKTLLADASSLIRNLASPDDDRASEYSRPFPPRPRHYPLKTGDKKP